MTQQLSLLFLAAMITLCFGCAELSSRPQSGMPSNMNQRQSNASTLIPGAIHPAHVTDSMPGGGSGFGLTKAN